MEILGYIVSKSKVSDILPYIKVVNSFNLIEDKTKPILIIGLEEAKKRVSSFSILEKRLSDNVFWTFGKREKRIDYEKDIIMFQKFVLKNVFTKIRYYYLNVLTIKYHKLKALLHIILKDKKNTFFIDKKMIYISYDNVIIGASVDIIEYLGLKKERIIHLLKKNKNNLIYYNDFLLNKEIKEILVDKKYMTTYFLSLNN